MFLLQVKTTEPKRRQTVKLLLTQLKITHLVYFYRYSRTSLYPTSSPPMFVMTKENTGTL